MATPGIGDPYWFEWYVGLKNIINMLNPDNGIEYVIFQCSKYNTMVIHQIFKPTLQRLLRSVV